MVVNNRLDTYWESITGMDDTTTFFNTQFRVHVVAITGERDMKPPYAF